LRIPESHIDIIKDETDAVLSTICNSEVYSAFCVIQAEDEEISLDRIDAEQINHIMDNEKVSIMVFDPTDIGRWFCIQGTIKLNKEGSGFRVNPRRILKFPK